MGQSGIGLIAAVATGQGDHAHHPWVVDEGFVKVGFLGQGELEHHLLIIRQRIKRLGQLGQKDVFGGGLVFDRDGHLGFNDRDHPMAQDLLTDHELLRHQGGNAVGRGGIYDRAHLGAENAFAGGMCQKRIKVGHGFHQAHAVGFILKAFVNLEERHNAALLPQIGGGGLATDLAVHCHFKQDRANHPVSGKGGRLRDARAHGMDQVKHLGLRAIGGGLNAIKAKRLGGGAARLVEGCDKTLA